MREVHAQAPERATETRRRSVDVDRVDLALFAAFAAVSLWVLALAIIEAVAHHKIWTGTDGVYLQDQMQYVAWIRDSSRHLLTSNLFVIGPTPHDYLQPMVAISGLIAALGVAPWLALLLWKPLVIGATLWAIRAYVRRTLIETSERRAALVLALFFVGPGAVATHFLGHYNFNWRLVSEDPWIGWWSWGYPYGLVSTAATLGAVLAYERERERGTSLGLSALLGAGASWLHPWQGVTLIVLLAACEGLEFLRTRRFPIFHVLLTCAAIAVPLAYLVVLSRADVSWKLGSAASQAQAWPLWVLAFCELPLAVPAMLAYRIRPLTFLGRATRVWPLAMLASYLFFVKTGTGGATLHVFLGVNVPLAILAVEGWRSASTRFTWLRQPAVVAITMAVLIVPALVDQLSYAEKAVSTNAAASPPHEGADAQFINSSESRALEYLARVPIGGGVLTRSYLGTIVPARSGHSTYVGDSYWSADYNERATAADRLFLGEMSAATARAFVRGTRARFLVGDCSSKPTLSVGLLPLVAGVQRFGCASVYIIR